MKASAILSISAKVISSPLFSMAMLNTVATVFLYFQFLLIVAFPVMIFLDKDNEFNHYSWPITATTAESKPAISANSDNITHYIVQQQDPFADKAKEKVLLFEDNSTGGKLLQSVLKVALLVITILITLWLKKLFTNIEEGRPFSQENSRLVRWIGLGLMSIVLFNIIKAFIYKLYITSAISLSGATFDFYDFSFDSDVFLMGLVVLALAEIFRAGNEYKSDSESIV